MDLGKDYYNSQLEAINSFYNSLVNNDSRQISLTEAIITWFTEGHAERFREEYLQRQSVAILH